MKQFRLSGFADEAGMTAEEQIRVLKINGIHSMEIRNIDGKSIVALSEHEIKEVRKKLDDQGISVSAIGSPVGKSPIEEDFSLCRATFDRALKAAEILAAPYIRAFSFYIPKEGDPMQWAGEVVSRLSELVKAAEHQGVHYALENESGIFTDIPGRCVYVFDRVPGLSLAFDPGNFIMNDADTLEAWKMLKKHLAYFHIKDAARDQRHFVPAGEGEGHISEILKDAFSGGFDGFLSIEPHLKYLENLNDAQRFTTAANALKKILNNLFDAGLEMVDISTLG